MNTGKAFFQAKNPVTGKPTLGFPPRPTVLQIRHELSHFLDCKTLGIEEYSKLSVAQKEQMVLDRLRENRVWSNVANDKEKQFSKDYVASKWEKENKKRKENKVGEV